MAVERRLTPYSGFRLDIPHLRSMESAVSKDFDNLLRGLFTGLNKPYLIRGFNLVIPQAALPVTSLQISVSDSAVLHSSATESGTILTVPAGTANETLDKAASSRVIGAFQNGVPNYVSLDYRRSTDVLTVDQTAGWSASQKLEFQRTTPIGKLLDYRFVITTSGPGTNLPLYIVGVDANGSVTYVTKAVPSLFRLGAGGTNPDPQYNFKWKNLANTQDGVIDTRQEWINQTPTLTSNPLTIVPGAGASLDAFSYGDFSITNLKEWMDAVMTRIKEITSSAYWYMSSALPTKAPNVVDLWWDTVGSVMTGAGNLSYNLILESTSPSDGAFQSQSSDSTVLSTDSYLIGTSSGTKANLKSFADNQLVINSLTNSTVNPFVFGETVQNRRLFRMNYAYWSMADKNQSSIKWASMQRLPSTIGASINVASWSYSDNNITVTTSAPHQFRSGDKVYISGLSLTVADPTTILPNGVFVVKTVPSTNSFAFSHLYSLTGTPAAGGSVIKNETTRHPYLPRHQVTKWVSDGASVTVTAPGNAFFAQSDQTCTTLYTSTTITVTDSSLLKVGMVITSGGSTIPLHTYIAKINGPTSIEATKMPLTSVTLPLTFNERVHIYYTTDDWSASKTYSIGNKVNYLGNEYDAIAASTNSIPDSNPSDWSPGQAPNGTSRVLSLGSNTGEIVIAEAGISATTQFPSSAWISPNFHVTKLTLNGAVPSGYDTVDAKAEMYSDVSFKYQLGSDALPSLGEMSGPAIFDGVVCLSKVQDPIRVQSIDNDGAGNLTVTTYLPHGEETRGPLAYIIYGDGNKYFTTYPSISITKIDSTSFILNGSGIIESGNVYSNPGTENVFIRFQNNPYPGPVQWDQDIYIKGIIGDRYFVIPKDATSTGTPVANKFGAGASYLQDGEVAYITLERNLSVSHGDLYTAAGGSEISGTGIPLDISGYALKSGDFVKFEDEDEGKWMRIAGTRGNAISGNIFNLENDRGQPATSIQRKAKKGRLAYCKGTYDTIQVKKHWEVEASADVYWIAVRRDNHSSSSKVYLKALELQAGEVRPINDNEMSNLLVYTGAKTESSVNPNYTVVDSDGIYQFTQPVIVNQLDSLTRMITFNVSPDLGFQVGDKIVKSSGDELLTYSVKHNVSSRTVIVNEDISDLVVSDSVTYQRANYIVSDSDNLTLAIRKEDREQAKINSALSRPIYDESFLIQQINLTGSGDINSGDYIYRGTKSSPTGLAWVLHGTKSLSKTIEGAQIAMPGGQITPIVGNAAILVAIISGSFPHGQAISQDATDMTGRTSPSRSVSNVGNPAFAAPVVASGVELVLPPNRRTQVLGSQYVVFPTHLTYKASLADNLCGEELMVIINDQIRQANVDYSETFSGPRGKIQLIRNLPANTRIRARLMSSYGSALTSMSSGVDLQKAYDSSNASNWTITESPGNPVTLNCNDPGNAISALNVNGSIQLNGSNGPAVAGGLFGPSDQTFLVGNETNKPKESWSANEFVKTHSSHPGSAVERFTAAGTSFGGSAYVIPNSNITIASDRSYRVSVAIVGNRYDTMVGIASFRLEGAFYNNGGVQAAGSPISTIIGTEADGNNYAAVFGTSGNDIVCVVYGASTGLGSDQVEWVATIEVQSVGSA